MRKKSAGTRWAASCATSAELSTGYGPSSNVSTASLGRAGLSNASRTSSVIRATMAPDEGASTACASVPGAMMTGTSSSCAWWTQRRPPTIVAATSIAATAIQSTRRIGKFALLREIVSADDDVHVAPLHRADGDHRIVHRQLFDDLAHDLLV